MHGESNVFFFHTLKIARRAAARAARAARGARPRARARVGARRRRQSNCMHFCALTDPPCITPQIRIEMPYIYTQIGDRRLSFHTI